MILKRRELTAITIAIVFSATIAHAQDSRAISFDYGWRFKKDTLKGIEAVGFDDSGWRNLNLPHDWSIEDLPGQQPGSVQGPFTKSSIGKSATGFTEGGTGWYRKTFKLGSQYSGKKTFIVFDGVYMNADIWINGHHLGNHPYGYTSFSFDLSPYLRSEGLTNVIAVRVQNQGKNSRWYAGSGIYRHVWLLPVDQVYTVLWGNYITTPQVSNREAIVKVESTLENNSPADNNISIKTDIINPSGTVVASKKSVLTLKGGKQTTTTLELKVTSPLLWTQEKPILYKTRVSVLAGSKIIDQTVNSFGIRSLLFDAQKGLLLNGKVIKLKGGCVHSDLGPLGTASLDRAEERKVELLKKAGYNAIRLSHNPPAPAFLDACDRMGMLVIDEAFDMWELSKSSQDYHLFFKDWWQKDLQSMMLRDRNHPSVMMWSIGNEIYEAPDSSGYRNAKLLSDEVRRLDPTRAVTEAFVYLPPYTKKPLDAYRPNLVNLDVVGYNYFFESKSPYFQRDSTTMQRFQEDKKKYPGKLFIQTEYVPDAALENWEVVEKYPYILGGFCWTAMDYIGEAGIGRPLLVPEAQKLPKGLIRMGLFYRDSWPVFTADCGDLDLIGNPKAALYYKDVVWRKSPVEMLVHRPVPAGMREVVAAWGFPDELKSWTWPGEEGKKIQVNVYSRSKTVKLELNGKMIARQDIPGGSITTTFEITYQPGTLVAKSYDGGRETGTDTLSTTGKAHAIRLVPDRSVIKRMPNDLSFVSVEIIDEHGQVVPDASDYEVQFQLSGDATIAGIGNGNHADMSSFQEFHKRAYQGRALAIIRPKGNRGIVILKATATGLKAGFAKITIE
ncbi:glycoside hydrolase family 2 TIM barrel-domain containing protein [Mucilaginibacter sp. cycad4]|uniref:glycoside hydrolase family 2 TIM barrel-domain containing protein n=1 Tax=Mucilaginibacter sp. cycad4 TaxID=3342096 RepID=UPI002AABB3CC|nr:glycoside hydrolase family 2 TIM barrel-domain containing protein [Mucilaginibacter gossypii]WPV01944.1 glycoside hydrolase family 2 TIM barrel-domain containing protein [Mucilaginibacter gossypii]